MTIKEGGFLQKVFEQKFVRQKSCLERKRHATE